MLQTVMIKILSNTYFKYLVVPLLTTFLVIFIKSVSRNDRHKFIKNEDFAFGLQMAVTAVLLMLGNSVTIAQGCIGDPKLTLEANNKLLLTGWIAPVLVFGLWGVSTIVRRLGWENETELNIFWGIIFPDIFGLILLIFVVSTIGN